MIDGKEYTSWSGGDLATTYKSFAAGTQLKLDQVIKKTDMAKVQSEGGKLKVKRCCVLKSDAESGTFEKCVKEPEQVVDFRVKIQS